MKYLETLDLDIKGRLCDFCLVVDGSLNDLLFEYDQNKAYLQNSPLKYEYYGRPSHLYAKAYRKVLRDYGYERRSKP
jgi:hypothetical protein